MAQTGQTINDRLNAVRYALAGQGLARTVCKATTEEVLGPKKKHMDYLLACTEEPNVSIPQLANLLIDRTQHSSWAVVFKSLITIHHLLNYGNERFAQYLATSNHSFELNDFMDRTTPQGYNMSTFVRLYAKYINEKISSYKSLALDLCKIKPGKENALRTMNMENLTKTLPIVHSQFDSLLDFNVEAKDVNNGVIMAAFRLLYKDLNRIFAAYQEAIINLVERFFKLSRKKARDALTMYKKYLDRLDKVATFFKIVDQIGLDKSEMPDTSKLTSLLGVFEAHLAQLEAKKRTATPSSLADETKDETASSSAQKENIEPVEQDQKSAVAVEAGADVNSGKKSSEMTDSSPATSASHSEQSAPTTSAKKTPPARPSPIVSPKASPCEPSNLAPGNFSEKKSVPERPAKPPSRPPPPSATGPTSAVPTSGSSLASTPSRSAASTPPPHPPPPAHPPAPKASSAAPPPQTTELAETETISSTGHAVQDPVAGQDNVVVNANISSPDSTQQPVCSGIVTNTINNEVESETEEPNTNHVAQELNGATNHVEEAVNEPAPPPPLANDEREPEVDQHAVEQPDPEDQHTNESENQEPVDGIPAVATNGHVQNLDPPPPPPPIDE